MKTNAMLRQSSSEVPARITVWGGRRKGGGGMT